MNRLISGGGKKNGGTPFEVPDSASLMGGSPVWVRWGALLAGLAVLGMFAFFLIPRAGHLPLARGVIESVEANGIDATGLFYTEVDLD